MIPSESRYRAWRRVHLIATGLLGVIAVIHCGLTVELYRTWSEDAVWFLGTGLALLLLAALNWTHIGVEPCRQRTTRLVRAANWVFAIYGIAAVVAVPSLQAYLIVACLVIQATAAPRTLPGPNN